MNALSSSANPKILGMDASALASVLYSDTVPSLPQSPTFSDEDSKAITRYHRTANGRAKQLGDVVPRRGKQAVSASHRAPSRKQPALNRRAGPGGRNDTPQVRSARKHLVITSDSSLGSPGRQHYAGPKSRAAPGSKLSEPRPEEANLHGNTLLREGEGLYSPMKNAMQLNGWSDGSAM